MALIKDKILYALDTSEAEISLDGSESLVEVLLSCIRNELSETGDRIIIKEAIPNHSHGQQEISLSQLEPAMTRVGNALKAEGVQQGDVVQFLMYNNVDFFIPVLAAWMLGAVVSMGDPSLAPDVLAQQMETTQPKLVFCSQPACAKVQAAFQLTGQVLKVVIVNPPSKADNSFITLEDYSQGFSAEDVPSGHENVQLGDPVAIFWSSGTTGNPKGIVLSLRNLLGNLANQIFTVYGKHQPVVQTTCMFHGGGFNFCLINAVRYANTLITFSLEDEVEPEEFFTAIDKYRVTFLMVGAHHAVLLATNDPEPGQDMSSVKSIVPMGAPVYAQFPEDFRKRFPNANKIVHCYGTTEVSGISLAFNDFTTLGALVRGASVMVVDPVSEELMGPNQVGEICAKTAGNMKGYINIPEEDKAKAFNSYGYFRTGDLGTYDEDGYLYYIDRLKSLIKYKGHHIYPAEVETVLRKHPDVLDVGVFGIPEPSVMELISAAVIKRKGSPLTAEELEEFANRQLDEHQKIRGGVHFVQSLPKNMQGKLLKRKLSDFVSTYER